MSIIRRKYQPYTENENQQNFNDKTDGIILFKFVPAYSIGLYVLLFYYMFKRVYVYFSWEVDQFAFVHVYFDAMFM